MLFGHEIERARRMNTALSICIVDLDHFKRVNDTYGHGVGDDVLRRTAAICRKNLRTVDIIGRLGGEEFIFLLPETTIDQAVVIGNRLLEALSTTDIDAGVTTIRITATIGISQLLPGDQDFNTLIQRADTALYRGKVAGRNRVEVNLM
jgi:diguanylate cyclase (GGDEF)-like protein